MTGQIGAPSDGVPSTASGPVHSLFEDYQGLVGDLSGGSPSGLTALNRSYHKHLLVAAASSLEERVKQLIPGLFLAHGRPEMGSFVAKQVLARGYHGLFDWKAESAQGFFGSFGEECGKGFRSRLKSDDPLRAEHQAFMRLGNLRNQVVHNDYATFPIDLTPNEVMERYQRALDFTDRFEELIFRPTL